MSKIQPVTSAHAWLVLMKAHRSLMRHAERSFKANDIGLSDFVVLEMLLHKGPQKVNDIGRKIALSSGAITIAVDRVERRGLVVRTFDATDRRARVVQLTPKGEALIRKAYDGHVRSMERATSGLSMSERNTLVSLLKKLGLSAERQLDQPEGRRSKGKPCLNPPLVSSRHQNPRASHEASRCATKESSMVLSRGFLAPATWVK